MSYASEPGRSVSAPESGAAALDFAQVYEDHFAFTWRTIRRMGVPAAKMDDVLQDVFLVVAQRLASFDPTRAHLRSWLYGIIMNVVSNERRRHRRKDQPCLPLVDDDAGAGVGERLASGAPGPQQAAETREAMRLASEILDSLPEERREILILADLEEMSVVEVAESLGLNVNTAHSRLRAARREFVEALARFHARSKWRST